MSSQKTSLHSQECVRVFNRHTVSDGGNQQRLGSAIRQAHTIQVLKCASERMQAREDSKGDFDTGIAASRGQRQLVACLGFTAHATFTRTRTTGARKRMRVNELREEGWRSRVSSEVGGLWEEKWKCAARKRCREGGRQRHCGGESEALEDAVGRQQLEWAVQRGSLQPTDGR
jgi:hypothetical protein